MKISIASDHGGFDLKEKLKDHYKNLLDLGTFNGESCDYPDIAEKMVAEIKNGKNDLGILICGTGIGVSIAANRYKGIRAAILYDDFVAKMAKEHNNANIIVFGGRTMDFDDVVRRINIFTEARFQGDRHQRRIDKMDK